MSKNYFSKRKRHYKYGSVFRLTKGEKMMFDIIYEMINIVRGIIIALYRTSIDLYGYISRLFINYYALKKTGYNLNEILDVIEKKLSPRQFEFFIAELYKQHGHKVKLTPPTKDYGRDVIVDGNIFIECKHFSRNGTKVGREICQKLLGSVQMFNAEKGIIVTTGKFHKNAYEVARMCDNLELMDLYDIQKMVLDLKPEQISRIMLRTLNAS